MKDHQFLFEGFYFSTRYQSKRNSNPKIQHFLLLLSPKFPFLSSTIALPPLHHFPKCCRPPRSFILPQVPPPSKFSIRHLSIHLVVPPPSKTSIRHLSITSPSAATLQKGLHLLPHPSKISIRCRRLFTKCRHPLRTKHNCELTFFSFSLCTSEPVNWEEDWFGA